MKIYLNGKETEVPPGTTLKALITDFLKLSAGMVVVERNKEVVPREMIDTAVVGEGDRIEVVHFVGGGSGGTEPAPKPAKKPAVKKKSPSKGPANLVIVESPAKAKTINKFLGKDYQVEASMGHVRDLPKSKMGVDIGQGFLPHYIVMTKARKRVNYLKKQAKGKKGIYLAPDPDREGEAISWHLAHIFGEGKDDNSKPSVHRVVFNEITKEAVQKAFSHPRTIELNLVYAQQARRILDRIVGYELSPLLWRNVGRGLSAGRVQSVALRLIVDREREIQVFVPEEYWSLEAKLASERPENRGKVFTAKLDRIGEEKVRLKNREETEKIKNEVSSLPFRVDKVEKTERRRRPQAPFTTSKLQQEAYNRLGFPASKTMSIAQKLYEGVELGDEGSVGLITYMRTDSVNIAVSAQKEAADFIRGKFGAQYLPETPPVYKSKKGAQEAHEAVRPTSVLRVPETVRAVLEDDEYKLYDLIWRKFVASQMLPAVDENVSVSIAAGEKYFFKATGRRTLFAGFGIVYSGKPAAPEEEAEGESPEAEEGADDLPALIAGDVLRLCELEGFQHFTKPPARYNDASLVKVLEEKGIGRPSTYAPTIYTLLSRGYVNRQSGALFPTELGSVVVDLLTKHFPKIMDIQFTALMEEELDKIEDGEMDWVSVLKDFYGPFHEYLTAAKDQMESVKQEAVPTDYNCDICGKTMMIKWGRFGKFLACSGFPDCKYTRSIPTGFRCPEPECGGELVKRMSKRRRTFYGCSNYPKCTYISNKLPAGPDGEKAPADRPAAVRPAENGGAEPGP